MSALIVPDTGLELVDGSIVILARFPSTKWVVHYGWYTYSGQQMMGWYFCSIPANTVIPASDADLRMLKVVSNSGSCNCPGNAAPVVPAPPAPGCPPGGPIQGHQAWELDRAFISVNTIAERNLLNKRLLPDGKIVRVGNDGDGPQYYRWNQVTGEWEIEHFGVDTQKFITLEQAEELFLKRADAVTQEDLNRVSQEITSVNDELGTIRQQAEAAMDAAESANASAHAAKDAAYQAIATSSSAQTIAKEACDATARNATDIQLAKDSIDAVATEVGGLSDSVEGIQSDLEAVKGQVSNLESDLQSQVDEALKTSPVLTDAVNAAVAEAVSAEVAEIHEQMGVIKSQIVEIREQIEIQDEWGALPAV